uniref:Uncharacterized protein AlNc14C21G2141 n=1 Tax=Albugo laibachii Nc14 TaxID=890382 RepID=F0W5H6_9STRA|nr:conserved hypothetical protein [Albugo laibachii Nc14]|eukprot:CCA16367.1 conserved hypothetical protein [Albugo laibachii Nc14]
MISRPHTPGTFPLRSDLFPPTSIPFEQQETLFSRAEETARVLLSQTFNDQWRYIPSDKDGAQVRKDTNNLSASYRLVRATSTIHCQEHELYQMFANTNSESWRGFLKCCLGKYFVDAMILHQIPIPRESDEDKNGARTLSVKWGVYETSVTGRRDLCVLDYRCKAMTQAEQLMNVWCFTSVEGEQVGCLSLKESHHLDRSELNRFGVFWHCVSADQIQITLCGSFPVKVASVASSAVLHMLNSIQRMIGELRVKNNLVIHRKHWIQDDERKTCSLCSRNFHALRRRHHCRRCGEIICAECSVKEQTILPFVGVSKLRLCKACCMEAKTTPLSTIDRSNVFECVGRGRTTSKATTSPLAYLRSSSTGSPCSSVFGLSCAEQRSLKSEEKAFGQIEKESVSPICWKTSSDEVTTLEHHLTPYDNREKFVDSPHDVFEVPSGNKGDISSSDNQKMHDRKAEKDGNIQMLFDHVDTTNTGSGSMFDLLCGLAGQTLDCPIASLCVLNQTQSDREANMLRSSTGLAHDPTLAEELSVFIYKVMEPEPTIVLDSSVDKRVQHVFGDRINSIRIRFFAGCVIYSKHSHKQLGYICVADFKKRDEVEASHAFAMERLASLAVTTMDRNLASSQCSLNKEQLSGQMIDSAGSCEFLPMTSGIDTQPESNWEHNKSVHNLKRESSIEYQNAETQLRQLLIKAIETQQLTKAHR